MPTARIHGVCGIVDPDQEEENQMLRICSTCQDEGGKSDVEMLERPPAGEEKSDGSEEGDEEEGGEAAPKRARKGASAKHRTVLTYKQKGEILALLDQRVTQAAIATRYLVRSIDFTANLYLLQAKFYLKCLICSCCLQIKVRSVRKIKGNRV
ncbi:unnamed protein product, partial [Phaeothamnion confervicola]